MWASASLVTIGLVLAGGSSVVGHAATVPQEAAVVTPAPTPAKATDAPLEQQSATDVTTETAPTTTEKVEPAKTPATVPDKPVTTDDKDLVGVDSTTVATSSETTVPDQSTKQPLTDMPAMPAKKEDIENPKEPTPEPKVRSLEVIKKIGNQPQPPVTSPGGKVDSKQPSIDQWMPDKHLQKFVLSAIMAENKGGYTSVQDSKNNAGEFPGITKVSDITPAVLSRLVVLEEYDTLDKNPDYITNILQIKSLEGLEKATSLERLDINISNTLLKDWCNRNAQSTNPWIQTEIMRLKRNYYAQYGLITSVKPLANLKNLGEGTISLQGQSITSLLPIKWAWEDAKNTVNLFFQRNSILDFSEFKCIRNNSVSLFNVEGSSYVEMNPIVIHVGEKVSIALPKIVNVDDKNEIDSNTKTYVNSSVMSDDERPNIDDNDVTIERDGGEMKLNITNHDKKPGIKSYFRVWLRAKNEDDFYFYIPYTVVPFPIENPTFIPQIIGNTVPISTSTVQENTISEESGQVTVQYLDNMGQIIAPDKVLTGLVGDTYLAPELTLSRYQLLREPQNEQGYFTPMPQTVIYTYQPIEPTTSTKKIPKGNGDSGQRPQKPKQPKPRPQTTGPATPAHRSGITPTHRTLYRLTSHQRNGQVVKLSVATLQPKLPQTNGQETSWLQILGAALLSSVSWVFWRHRN